MTVEEIINIMEPDQPIQIIHAHNYVESIVFSGVVENCKQKINENACKILTPIDSDIIRIIY